MLERFYPRQEVESAYVIPYEKLYERGIRGVIFDVDNTLVLYVVSRQMSGHWNCFPICIRWG